MPYRILTVPGTEKDIRKSGLVKSLHSGRLRQEDQKFKLSLGNLVRSCFKINMKGWGYHLVG